MKRLLLVLLVLAGCKVKNPKPFKSAMALAGRNIPASVLNYGREQYTEYCAACHGPHGDGRGPASKWLRPPPRDFRSATFKFAKVLEGLPNDDDLARIVHEGLAGTAMLPWELPDKSLHAILQYIKTFSPDGTGYRDPDAWPGKPIEPPPDPWTDKTAAASRGREVYHAYQCWSCHPAYAPEAEIAAAFHAIRKADPPPLRPNVTRSELKTSDEYSAPLPTDVACETDDECDEPELEKCAFGRCELKLRIKPPDFLMDPVRSGDSAVEIYRTLRGGIPGSGMPEWNIDPKDMWAVAWYVHSLAEVRGTPTAIALRRRLTGGR